MKVIKLNTSYKPKKEKLKDVKLPIELRNKRGDLLATIDHDGNYYVSWVLHKKVTSGESDFTECLTETFGYLYQKMIDLKKVEERHNTLVEALRLCLKTPFNNI